MVFVTGLALQKHPYLCIILLVLTYTLVFALYVLLFHIYVNQFFLLLKFKYSHFRPVSETNLDILQMWPPEGSNFFPLIMGMYFMKVLLKSS